MGEQKTLRLNEKCTRLRWKCYKSTLSLHVMTFIKFNLFEFIGECTQYPILRLKEGECECGRESTHNVPVHSVLNTTVIPTLILRMKECGSNWQNKMIFIRNRRRHEPNGCERNRKPSFTISCTRIVFGTLTLRKSSLIEINYVVIFQ